MNPVDAHHNCHLVMGRASSVLQQLLEEGDYNSEEGWTAQAQHPPFLSSDLL